MLKTSKLIIVLFFLFLITGTCNAQKKNSSSPFFFIQVTDPQFGFFEAKNGFGKETELYEKAITMGLMKFLRQFFNTAYFIIFAFTKTFQLLRKNLFNF